MTDQIATTEAALPWTEERVQLLRKLWEEGLSASRIATALAGGVSRNAVIGKVHRLGLSGRAKSHGLATASRARLKAPMQQARTQIPQRAVAMHMHGNTALAVQTHALPAPRERSSDDVVVPIAAAVTIMDLRESMCRWPVGDPSSADFRYCGGKAPIGAGPYCSFHSRMAYQPVQDRNRRRSA